MKIVAVVAVGLLFVGACTDRKAGEGDESETGTGNAEDLTTATPTTGELDNPSGFCSPVAQNPAVCPQDYICCSDDPATTQGRLPNYFNGKNDEVYGVPIFSGANNALSYSGQCVEVGGFSSPFGSGCPVPCNPTWTAAENQTICGAAAVCCPFQTVDSGQGLRARPGDQQVAVGAGQRHSGAHPMGGDPHTTNQDPNGTSCNLFATPGGGPLDLEALADCYAQLTVADQRGFCYFDCPCYEDLCDQKNPGYVSRCG
jgi:hypothetical protein